MTETIETEIEIAAAPEVVWKALTDYAGYGEWNPYLIRIEGELLAGSTIIVHSKPAPDRDVMVQPVDVVFLEAPRAMRWEGGMPDREQFKGDHWWVLEVLDEGSTRLRHFEHFSGALAPQILTAYGEAIRANFIRFNEALKAHVESLRP